jgi:hypothetical protein
MMVSSADQLVTIKGRCLDEDWVNGGITRMTGDVCQPNCMSLHGVGGARQNVSAY